MIKRIKLLIGKDTIIELRCFIRDMGYGTKKGVK